MKQAGKCIPMLPSLQLWMSEGGKLEEQCLPALDVVNTLAVLLLSRNTAMFRSQARILYF